MGIGPAAFWIAIAAIIISWGYFRSRSEAAKHETLRHIIEKTGQVDESQFRALFPPSPDSMWAPKPAPPGTGYRVMRVLGTVVMCVAIGLGLFFTFLTLASAEPLGYVMTGYASASLVLFAGVGLFLGANYLPKPNA
jgi:amino acid transporter